MSKARKSRPRKPVTAKPTRSAPASRPRTTSIVGTEELGLRMRKVRLERRMTLKQVERSADLSATHLSEIERGRTSPTIGALVRIARALGRDTSFFIEREERNDVVQVGRDQASRITLSPGVEASVLTRGIPGSHLFAYRMTLTPGAGRHGEFRLAAREAIDDQAVYYVRSGEAISRFGDDDEVRLAPGDGVQAALTLAHALRPAGSKPVEMVVLLTQPIDGGQ